jgi:di/tricarboxylate transporter
VITLFDYVTVACFFCTVAAFFIWTRRDSRTLLHLLISGVAFAIANHLGNNDLPLFALVLIVAGAGYALLVVQGRG